MNCFAAIQEYRKITKKGFFTYLVRIAVMQPNDDYIESDCIRRKSALHLAFWRPHYEFGWGTVRPTLAYTSS